MNANSDTAAGQVRSQRRALAKAAGVLGALTLLSRVSGLIRDVVIGALFGASAAADAFFVAFRIPNLFRRLVAEGASSTAFVPVFSSERETRGDRAALEAAAAVGGVAFVVLAGLSVAGWWFADDIVRLFAPGFADDVERWDLAVELTAAVFPYLLLVGLAAWAMGTLHTFRHFATPAFGPICLNLAIISAALSLTGVVEPPIYALVVGVLVGGALQFAVQIPALARVGIRPKLLIRVRHPAVRRVGRLLVPTLLGGAVYQINVLVATMFASMLPERSVSYLWYADRLFEFPLGIVAVAVGTAVLPDLASHASAERYTAMGEHTRHALQLVWTLCVPAVIGLWVLAEPLVAVLFERGEFGALDTRMTAAALRAYALGLLGVASIRVLVSVFYALERPQIPVRTAVLALVVNAVCDLALMGPVDVREGGPQIAHLIADLAQRMQVADLDHVGLALGTAIAATVNAGLLFAFARRALATLALRKLGIALSKSIIAAVVMGVAVKLAIDAVAIVAGESAPYVQVVLGLVTGLVIYGATALSLGSEEIREFSAAVWRRLRMRDRGI